jgi:hypothetical protein
MSIRSSSVGAGIPSHDVYDPGDGAGNTRPYIELCGGNQFSNTIHMAHDIGAAIYREGLAFNRRRLQGVPTIFAPAWSSADTRHCKPAPAPVPDSQDGAL